MPQHSSAEPDRIETYQSRRKAAAALAADEAVNIDVEGKARRLSLLAGVQGGGASISAGSRPARTDDGLINSARTPIVTVASPKH
jgi:hypothetical protein